MSKMRVLMFALAIGSAVVAGLLARGVIGKKQTQQAEVITKVKTVDVLIAAKDIEVGEKLVAGVVAWKAWPADNVQDSMVTKDEKPDAEELFAEARASVPMFEGETVLEKKIVFPGQGGFMSAYLPKGMRAVSMAITSRSSAGGFILPNDRVDILLTKKLKGNGSAELIKTEIVMHNVRVLAINQTFRQAKEGEDVSLKEGETATIEITPVQAEVMARVETEGELSLALRSIAESEGKAMEEGPQLADKYRGRGTTTRQSDTLYVRYGIETYGANR